MARRAVVRHLGRLVHLSADAVADILPHDGEAVLLHILLHRVTDVRDAAALAGVFDALEEALPRDVDEPLRLLGNLSAGVGRRTVAVEPADIRAHVHADDIALLQDPFAGDAVDDLVVDGDADAGGIAVVVQERRLSAL